MNELEILPPPHGYKKYEKLIFLALAVCAFLGILLFIPPIQRLILSFAERFLLHRSLAKPKKWLNFLNECGTGILLLCLFVFLYIKNPFGQRSVLLSFPLPVLIAICTLCSALMVYISCISGDIWFDESFSLALIKHPVKEVISLTARDVHPPLYYLILALVLKIFPESVTAAKITSALPMCAVLFTGAVFLHKTRSKTSALTFVLLVMASQKLLQYSVEIRMYSWASLFVLLTALCGYRMLLKNTAASYIAYAVCALLCAYTQYYAAVAVLMHLALMAIILLKKDRRNIKKLALLALCGIIGYLPWIPCVLKQFGTVSKSYWIGPMTARTVRTYFEVFFWSAKAPYILAVLMGIAALLWALKPSTKDKAFYATLLLSPLMLILAGIALNLATRPIFVNRYVVPTIPLMLIFVSGCVPFAFRNRLVAICLLVVLAVFSVLNVKSAVKSEKNNAATLASFQKDIEPFVTPETQFVYTANAQVHLIWIFPYLYSQNQHFTATNYNGLFAEVLNIRYKPYKEIDTSKPYIIMGGTEESDKSQDKIPENLSVQDQATLHFPNYESARFYFGHGN